MRHQSCLILVDLPSALELSPSPDEQTDFLSQTGACLIALIVFYNLWSRLDLADTLEFVLLLLLIQHWGWGSDPDVWPGLEWR